MKKHLLSLALALLPMLVFSQHRSESEAIAVAQEFWGGKVNRAKLKAVSQNSIEKAKARVKAKGTVSGNKQSFYVINDEDNNRFVIVSSDNRLYKILGYSDNGAFDADSAPEGLLEMMNGYDEQYTQAYEVLDKIRKDNEHTKTHAIEPLIKTKWGQSEPFDLQCPIDKRESDGRRCAAGCVATAMAQIMNFYQYPSNGIGSLSYITGTQRIPQSMDFSATTFNWDLMLNVYDEKATEEEKAEVAKLMHACGVAVAMDYGEWKGGASGAAAPDIPYALINYFGYNPNIVYRHRDYYSTEEWNGYIMEELESGRPLLYGGFNREYKSGHRFILDGCDGDGLYHFNFGWAVSGYPEYAGYANGYYSLDALHAEDLRIDALAASKGKEIDLGDYSYNQSIICNITPNETGIHEDIFYCLGFSKFNTTTVGSRGTCTLKVECYSSESSSNDPHNPQFDGNLGIGLFDINFNFIKPLMSTRVTCRTYKEVIIASNVTLDAATFTDGSQYIIAPYAKSNKWENPSRIRAKYGNRQYYLAKCSNGVVEFIENGIAEAEHVITGPYSAISNDGKAMWQINLRQDDGQEGVYWISNLDPAVSDDNEVRCVVNTSGKMLSVDVNQEVREGIRLYTQTGGNTLQLYLNASDSTIVIKDIWGSIETFVSEGNISQHELSRYAGTNFKFGELGSGNIDVVETVSKPVISCSSEDNVVKIYCSTENAEIHYTLDGTLPTRNSTLYVEYIKPTRNCTIKAVAVKGDKISETVQREIDWFILQKPDITLAEDSLNVIMSCEEAEAKIYYTIDGTTPTEKSMPYHGPIPNNETATYQAVAYKDGYKPSPIAVRFIEAHGEVETSVTVADNIAGKLAEKLTDTQITNTVSLAVSGEINGTDIKLIREMLQKGHLASLNLESASLVSGGDKYYSSYVTKDSIITTSMFDGCVSLVEVKLPKDIVGIESFAFDGCKNLNKIEIPETCREISPYALSRCSNLENIYVVAENSYLKSVDGVLYSKDGNTLLRYPIGRNVSHFSIPEGVLAIGNRAFYQSSIKTFSLPNTLERIESYAFSNCRNITSIEIPESVTVMDDGAFDSCNGLYEVKMSPNVKELKSHVFGFCVNLRTFMIGSYIEKISEYAFSNCKSLQSIDVDPENPYFCTYNNTVYSSDMKTLVLCPRGLYADEYYVAENVITIENRAFAGCKNIENIILPESLSTIGSYAFNGCTMKSIKIPDNVLSISNDAFYGCDSLESFTFPNLVTKLESNVLGYCNNISYVYIPENVNYIGSSALRSCKSLRMIESHIVDISNVEMYESSYSGINAFDGIPDDCTWRVPNGCADEYRSQKWWVPTWTIIEDPDAILHITNDKDMKVLPGEHSVDIVSSTDKTINIYNLQGYLVISVKAKAGQRTTIPLQSGVYVINRNKIRIK